MYLIDFLLFDRFGVVVGFEGNFQQLLEATENTDLLFTLSFLCFQGLWINSPQFWVLLFLYSRSQCKWLSFTGQVTLSWQMITPGAQLCWSRVCREPSSYLFRRQFPRSKSSASFHGDFQCYTHSLLWPGHSHISYILQNLEAWGNN